jgi:excisionase family DNA binding protein
LDAGVAADPRCVPAAEFLDHLGQWIELAVEVLESPGGFGMVGEPVGALLRPTPTSAAAPDAPGQATPGNTSEFVLLLTIEDAGKALGVGRSTVYELIGNGDLEVVHIGRSARVPVESVQGFVRRLRAG